VEWTPPRVLNLKCLINLQEKHHSTTKVAEALEEALTVAEQAQTTESSS